MSTEGNQEAVISLLSDDENDLADWDAAMKKLEKRANPGQDKFCTPLSKRTKSLIPGSSPCTPLDVDSETQWDQVEFDAIEKNALAKHALKRRAESQRLQTATHSCEKHRPADLHSVGINCMRKTKQQESPLGKELANAGTAVGLVKMRQPWGVNGNGADLINSCQAGHNDSKRTAQHGSSKQTEEQSVGRKYTTQHAMYKDTTLASSKQMQEQRVGQKHTAHHMMYKDKTLTSSIQLGGSQSTCEDKNNKVTGRGQGGKDDDEEGLCSSQWDRLSWERVERDAVRRSSKTLDDGKKTDESDIVLQKSLLSGKSACKGFKDWIENLLARCEEGKLYDDLCSVISHCAKHLKTYQKAGIVRIWELENRCLLYDEMGLGKTLQALFAMAGTCISKQLWPVLIVCPASLRMNWLEEIEKWLICVDIADVKILGGVGQRVPSKDTKIFIVSYRGVAQHREELSGRNFKYIIADEVHKTRTFNSKSTLALSYLARSTNHVVMLTGTPMLIRPFEVFTQIQIALRDSEKNMLLANWGNSNKITNSHLRRVTQSPIRHLQGISLVICPQRPNIQFLQDSDTWRNCLNVYQHEGLSRFWALFSQPQQDCILGIMEDFLKELQDLIRWTFIGKSTANVKIYSDLETGCKKVVSKSRRCYKSKFAVQNMEKKLDALDNMWDLLQTESESDNGYLLWSIVHIWDAHRFGMLYCRGKKVSSGPYFALRRQYEYNGINTENQSLLREAIRKHSIRRKKNDVLEDLPEKRRAVIFIKVEQDRNKSSVVSQLCTDQSDQTSSSQNLNSNGLEKMIDSIGESVLEEVESFDGIPPGQICWELQMLGMRKANQVANHLINVLDDIDRDERVILFAYHVKVLEMISSTLCQKQGDDPEKDCFRAYSSCLLSGGVPVDERDRSVRLFQSNEQNAPRVLLLSMSAMGTGFTMTRSSIVVMAELFWSPQILLQAEDRAHRIGQPNSVYIQYLLVEDSIEMALWSVLCQRLENMESTLAKPGDQNHENPSQERPVVWEPPTQASNTDYRDELGFTVPHPEEIPCSSEDLRFMVSETNRVHLYKQLAGGRCIPLRENFSLTDFGLVAENIIKAMSSSLEQQVEFASLNLLMIPKRLRNPTADVCAKTQAFVGEWMELTNIQRYKFRENEVPLNIPFETATSGMDSQMYSFDRVTKPDRQMHKSAMLSVGSNNYTTAFVKFIKRGVSGNPAQGCLLQAFLRFNGKPLCVYCGAVYSGKHRYLVTNEADDSQPIGQVVIQEPITSLFCGDGAPCYFSWHRKCYAGSARKLLAKIEKGVCRKCKVDTRAMFYKARVHVRRSDLREKTLFCDSGIPTQRLCGHMTTQGVEGGQTRLHWSKLQRELLGEAQVEKLLYSEHLQEGQFWDADHELAVALGGGSAELDNYQTLCKPCHLAKTKADMSKIKALCRKQRAHMKSCKARRVLVVGSEGYSKFCEWCNFQCTSLEKEIQ
eukprot:CAMPEP_0203753782 /NCGR_PEP_ID=MMETSP0098-20131031/7497_1 /ASSEMBLY_ACC=CAM_ASM_000208 /TAXON_ID=96639 /ORGANISM=" , Strain NY0313808BC1" /LENGTH=1463 /DNA_ID=CAMNT_0050644529 /DNA_START=129 /DNA_END=4517 /DNA_ORIENTATION=+